MMKFIIFFHISTKFDKMIRYNHNGDYMNIFQIIFLDVILLLFPLLIYLIYLSTNKKISNNSKTLYFYFALITSFFLVLNFGLNEPKTLSILVLNSVVVLALIENKLILSNILFILILLLNINTFNNLLFLLLILLFFNVIYVIKNKTKLNDYIFTTLLIIISSIIYYIWLYVFNIEYYNLINMIIVIMCYMFILNITCLIYETSKKILVKNTTLKELEKEKQIRLSLFKITHEIKNPIAVCKGYLDMLNVKDEKQVERYIPILKSEIDRLLSLLQDFLSINKSNLEIDIMDINMLIEDVALKMESLIDNKKINLNLDLLDDELYINGDYNRLCQVIINILKNSVESIETSGNINIKTILKNKKVNLIIEDNGCGMDKETLNKISEPFFTTKKRGAGLGVSLIYEIIEAHNAKINYQSEKEKGTIVTIKIPLFE